LLATDRARSTVLTTVLTGQRRVPYGEPPVMVAAFDEGGPVAAVLQTPPHPLTTVAVADELDASVWDDLAAVALAAGAAPPVISGPTDPATAMGRAWSRTTGSRAELLGTMLLYRLGSFTPPLDVPGRPRPIDADDPADVDLVARWVDEFARFTRQLPAPEGPDPVAVRNRAARGVTTVLWEVDGRAVALAGHSPVLGGMSRIGPVFTPEPERNRRYGSAVTAACVDSAVAAGATDIVLFTDADYPTSNAVYQRLGFVSIGDFVNLAVGPPER
jgi:hypothetical protein